MTWKAWNGDCTSARIYTVHYWLHQRCLLVWHPLLDSNLASGSRELENLPISAVSAVFLATPDGKARQNLFNYLETWQHVKPRTNGHDLKERGLPPGPRYQQVLQRLREAWLDEDVKTENEEMKLLDLLTNRKKIVVIGTKDI